MAMANSMFILTWKCMGRAGEDFKVALKYLIVTHKPNIVVLTKTRISREAAERIMPQFGYPNSARVDGC